MLRIADDIALLANTERKLEEALNLMETTFNNYNMKIKTGRTKSGKKRLNIIRCTNKFPTFDKSWSHQ